MSLKEKLQQIKAASRGKLPPETAAVMAEATEQLKRDDYISHALGFGKVAPQFSLPDQQGAIYRSGELLSKGPLILTFYRGSW